MSSNNALSPFRPFSAYPSSSSGSRLDDNVTINYADPSNLSNHPSVVNLKQATFPIFNESHFLTGNAVAISPEFLLISGNSVGTGNVTIDRAIAEVVFEGTLREVGFKILKVSKETAFDFISLDEKDRLKDSVDSKDSVEVYYKMDEVSQRCFDFLDYYKSASSANFGAPIMSLDSGLVHAIRGEKIMIISDIYEVLKNVSYQIEDPRCAIAQEILGKIQVKNLKTRGSFELLDEHGRNHNFSYRIDIEDNEMSYIKIFTKNESNSAFYQITPNLSNGYTQEQKNIAYETFARALGECFLSSGRIYFANIEAEVLGRKFTLDLL